MEDEEGLKEELKQKEKRSLGLQRSWNSGEIRC